MATSTSPTERFVRLYVPAGVFIAGVFAGLMAWLGWHSWLGVLASLFFIASAFVIRRAFSVDIVDAHRRLAAVAYGLMMTGSSLYLIASVLYSRSH